jgi:hypothetical protein
LNNFCGGNIVILFWICYLKKGQRLVKPAANPASLFRRRLGFPVVVYTRGQIYARTEALVRPIYQRDTRWW